MKPSHFISQLTQAMKRGHAMVEDGQESCKLSSLLWLSFLIFLPHIDEHNDDESEIDDTEYYRQEVGEDPDPGNLLTAPSCHQDVVYFVSSREQPWRHWGRHMIYAARRILYASILWFLFERVRKHICYACDNKDLPLENLLASRSFSRRETK